MQIKNYKAALASLDKISNKDSRLEEAYQRVAFFRGLELFKNLELKPQLICLISHLNMKNITDRSGQELFTGGVKHITGLADYDKAKADYELFMGLPGSMLLSEYNLVRYNLGYAFSI